MSGLRIGVDLGGTKIEAIGLDATGRERLRLRAPTPQGDYAATLAAIAELVQKLEAELGDRGRVGVGMPGTISPASGLVKNANSTWLNGRPLSQDLRRLLDRPIRFANDANCFALSEATDGAGAGARVTFGVIIGTGTGGGVVVEGKVLTGPNAVAGEWGHNPLPWPRNGEWPGPSCYCGRSGCLETFLSGPGLARDYEQATGRRRSPREIIQAADDEPEAEAALARYEERMARGLASVINLLDPDVIVLAAASPTSSVSTRACRGCGLASFSRTGSTRACCLPVTALRAAYAGRPGCGRRTSCRPSAPGHSPLFGRGTGKCRIRTQLPDAARLSPARSAA